MSLLSKKIAITQIHTLYFRLFLGILAASGVFSGMIALPIFPFLETHFHCSSSLAYGTMTSMMLGSALGQFIWGPLSDQYGRLRVLYWGFFVSVGASLLCATAVSIEVVLIGRFIQGIGTTVGIVVSRAICRDLYKPPLFDHMIAWILTIIPFSTGLAPAFGSLLSAYGGWRSCFIFSTCFFTLMIFAARFFLRDKPLFQGDTSLKEIRTNYHSFFHDPLTLLLLLTMACVFICLFLLLTSAPKIFRDFFHSDSASCAIALFLFPFGVFCGGLAQSVWGWKQTWTKVATYAWSIMGLSLALNFALVLSQRQNIWGYVSCLLLFGASIALLNSLCSARLMRHHPAQMAGNLSSCMGIVQTLGSAMGSWLAASLETLEHILLSVVVVCGICFVVFLAGRRHYLQCEEPEGSDLPSETKYGPTI